MARYQVIVGNVGTVYNGTDGREATETYLTYLQRSQADTGRAAGESVTLISDGEPVREYAGTLCPTCGSPKPAGQSCGCFDNGCE